MTNQENIERKLNHVLEMGKRIVDLYPHITCTERVALLLAMTAAVRQVATNIRNVAAIIRKHLLDPFGIDYIGYARNFENQLKIWREELGGTPIFHNLDNMSRPVTNANDIVLKEDTDYDLTLHSVNEAAFDFMETRVGLMENASVMCEAIENGLEEISRALRGIVDDHSSLKADTHRQDERLKELETMYEEAMWEEDRKRLKGRAREYAVLCNNRRDKETYTLFLEHLVREATDPHDFKHTAELNEWFLAGERPAAFIVERRDKLTMEDLARHFCFVRCYRLVKQHIESIDLMLPAGDEYKDLFVNRAAQELAFLLAHTICRCVDFRHNYQYAALQMAMQDLGLIHKDRANGGQMRDFLNATYLKKDGQIKDQTTLTQWTGKLLGGMFGNMDEQNLKGNYTLGDFNKMKDYYWLCLSIFNKVVQADLRKQKFAAYLYEDHELTPNITDYRNREGQSIMERLSVLKSALRGVTPL